MRIIRDIVIVSVVSAMLAILTAVIGTKVMVAAPADWCDQTGDVTILGDSTSTGYGATGYQGGNEAGYEPTEYGWTSRLMAELADEHGVTVWNYARNGALVSDFLPADVGQNNPRTNGPLHPNAVDDIADVNAGLVIVVLGANEFGYGTGQQPAVYEANLVELLDRIDIAVGAEVLLVHSWEFTYRWPGNSHSWGDYGDTMAQVAQVAGARYLDLTERMPATSAPHDAALLYHVDEYGDENAVHATDAGNLLLAEIMATELRCDR